MLFEDGVFSEVVEIDDAHVEGFHDPLSGHEGLDGLLSGGSAFEVVVVIVAVGVGVEGGGEGGFVELFKFLFAFFFEEDLWGRGISILTEPVM